MSMEACDRSESPVGPFGSPVTGRYKDRTKRCVGSSSESDTLFTSG